MTMHAKSYGQASSPTLAKLPCQQRVSRQRLPSRELCNISNLVRRNSSCRICTSTSRISSGVLKAPSPKSRCQSIEIRSRKGSRSNCLCSADQINARNTECSHSHLQYTPVSVQTVLSKYLFVTLVAQSAIIEHLLARERDVHSDRLHSLYLSSSKSNSLPSVR